MKNMCIAFSFLVTFFLIGCGGGSDTPQTDLTEAFPGKTLYRDSSGNVRVADKTPAQAEYHAKLGYGNTLFDSADKKCQHCHNDLYDTWKGSMHANSWSDPIFQAKYQDFLRTHIAKIGEDKTAVGGLVYSEKMFTKVAQTCLKCHAPGAYYAQDFKITLKQLAPSATTESLAQAKKEHQGNLSTSASRYNPHQSASVVAVSKATGALYQATYHIGHEANREGINCAFCHSIETPRLSGLDVDNQAYTLAKDLRIGAHGPIKYLADTVLHYDKDPSAPHMNAFFKLVGPEKYADFANTPKQAGAFDQNKTVDGRYTMHSIDINGTDGKVHFTGGPYYGPFGVTGTTNENPTDQSDRKAKVSPAFDPKTHNHFGNYGKALCLSCHQRSAGAVIPSPHEGAGSFMELCSTQMAVSTGDDNGFEDTPSSPKCQKCHMERIEGRVLHKWAKPDALWKQSDFDGHLLAYFDPDDTTVPQGENPVRDGWLNSHAFLGASKVSGHKNSAVAKIQSGFFADVNASVQNGELIVQTKLQNLTAHMFPGAHPMRRVLTRVIVTDAKGEKIAWTQAKGISTFSDIANRVTPIKGKALHASAIAQVHVKDGGSIALDFPGKASDLNGSEVVSQRFSGEKVLIFATDNTVANQEVNTSGTYGYVTNSAIVDDDDRTMFTRIYGHETGKFVNGVFVVRPGFDSNVVGNDNRLSPNESETYTLTYPIATTEGVRVTYKVYYMQKGASGKFIEDASGWLDQAASDAKKLLVSEVFSKSVTVTP